MGMFAALPEGVHPEITMPPNPARRVRRILEPSPANGVALEEAPKRISRLRLLEALVPAAGEVQRDESRYPHPIQPP